MFGFHRRARTVIEIKDMGKIEKSDVVVETIEQEEEETYTPSQMRNLTMIYLLFLAEATMATSLSSQIAVLVPSTTGCLNMNTSFLRSILECSYFFGSATGIFWGCAADRLGRRRVALIGLSGMTVCCLVMGFATSFASFALLRFLAGSISSAATISGAAMLADSTHGSQNRTKIVARLPLIAVCGGIGPLASHIWMHAIDGKVYEIFAKFPGLSGQIACTALVLTIAIAESLLLEETLPNRTSRRSERKNNADCEDVAFLDHRLSTDSDDSSNISIMEALNDDGAAPLPSKITLMQMLTAPSVLILLASYSLLSLHSSTFETLLPHIGHTATHNGGMGISCSWLRPTRMVVQILAATRVLKAVPFVVSKVGVLQMYRKTSVAFPVLYAIVPLVALAVSVTGADPIASAVVSTIAMLAKAAFAGAAQVLVLLLVLSAAPDASSTGAVLGVVSTSELFRALAVGISGFSYYLSDGYSLVVVNSSLWAFLVLIALVGAAVTWGLRETPRVGADIPADCLVWQGVFDVESEDEPAF